MTQPDEQHLENDKPGTDAKEFLRNELLLDGLAMCVPMAQVTSVTKRNHLADTVVAEQNLVLRTIRSLLEDGLMKIGDILGASDERVVPWDLSIDDAMDRVHDLFVGHYDEPTLWDLTIWLQLTPEGERLAESLKSQTTTEPPV
ncbi:hypothetical protein MMAN_18640 [Mycobacterium mantenii]|uniref:Uncharacterized protein n=1 Tax=Mycobacterium mantenii TaxID=560555 RepID=A0A1X0FBB3_MYCNT|nr:hypothetical protein [Mycobacterium mantenii]MCV7245289.1 hypothetical protein [Mycobacterium mantenii]ORA98798.1 hypothetical protein BST30_25450 [Mycobacterium mantenii]BBY37730.1 hypothetical protein MMAN_18640 [Mycobacterium mantenii]